MTIHAHASDFRLPCFLDRKFQNVPSKNFQGNLIILCYHRAVNEQNVCFLETRTTQLANSGWTLAPLWAQPLPSCANSWSRPFQEIDLPIVTDPLKQFRRGCTLFLNFPFQGCKPLVFGHRLYLKFRVRHDLNRRGFSPVWKFAKRVLFQHVPIRRVRKSLSFNPRFTFTSQLRNQAQRPQKGTGFHELSPEFFKMCA